MSFDYIYKQTIENLSSKIESSRKLKGKTQKDIAFLCDMEEQNYRRIEKGETNPTLKSLVKICVALEMEITDLFK